MKKLAKDVKKGDKILLAGQICILEAVEISDIGKQGKRKVRIVAVTSKGERVIIIRPEDYPLDV